MAPHFQKLFRAPYSVPNGIQVTPQGGWIADQITDRVALVDVAPANDYGVTLLRAEVATESSNTSGLSVGDNALWLAANGSAAIWRDPRPTDASQHMGEILKVDPATGRTLQRWPLPGGGGTHGLEVDPFEPDTIWLTTLKSQTLSKVRISDWSVLHTLPLPYTRAHGVVRVEDGIWVVFTSDRLIVKLDPQTGAELDRIHVPSDQPEPHCLSADGDNLLYCDATSGWVVRITF